MAVYLTCLSPGDTVLGLDLAASGQSFNHRNPDGQIRNEVSVHDIDMNEVRTAPTAQFGCGLQIRQIGRQDGWC